jgi:hypothetical protein
MRQSLSAVTRDHGDAFLAGAVGFSATAMSMIAIALLFA